ncbi:MAG: YdeI/OmpD-associated family protein [Candidatus Acidiferrales bacterium]
MKPTFFSSGAEVRKWLAANYAKVSELYFGFYKQSSGKGGVTYFEALDEALCFGWIDGVRKSHDESSFTVRFTPRKARSNWSAVNIRRATELKKLGRMQAPGLAAFEGRDRKRDAPYSYERREAKLPRAYEKEFRANKSAWEFWEAQPPYYRRLINWWVISAKQEETRERRLGALIAASAAGRRIEQILSKK